MKKRKGESPRKLKSSLARPKGGVAKPPSALEPPDWLAAREPLKDAIRTAFPLLVRKWLPAPNRIAGIGLYFEPLWGTVGLHLLTEQSLPVMGPEIINDVYEWPGTAWGRQEDVSFAFRSRWEGWQTWFEEQKKAFFARMASGSLTEGDRQVWLDRWRGLFRIGCEAIRDLEAAGFFAAFPMMEGFKVIVTEPNEEIDVPGLAVRRYPHFLQTGVILLQEDIPPEQRPPPRRRPQWFEAEE